MHIMNLLKNLLLVSGIKGSGYLWSLPGLGAGFVIWLWNAPATTPIGTLWEQKSDIGKPASALQSLPDSPDEPSHPTSALPAARSAEPSSVQSY